MSFVAVQQLTKTYTVGTRQLVVLRGLDLAVEQGEMVAVVGASGVGKSTLLQVVGGLDSIDAGTVLIGGTDITAVGDDARVTFRNRRVGFVFQFHHLLSEFTATENVAMPLRIARVPPSEAESRAVSLLEEVGLVERIGHRPGMLSGGERQRVAVARALVTRPALLLADEPTGDLDEETGDELQGLIRRIHATHGLTSIIATHNVKLAESCDRVLRLEGGCLRPV